MCSSDPFFLIILLVMCVSPFQGIIRATPSGELQASPSSTGSINELALGKKKKKKNINCAHPIQTESHWK